MTARRRVTRPLPSPGFDRVLRQVSLLFSGARPLVHSRNEEKRAASPGCPVTHGYVGEYDFSLRFSLSSFVVARQLFSSSPFLGALLFRRCFCFSCARFSSRFSFEFSRPVCRSWPRTRLPFLLFISLLSPSSLSRSRVCACVSVCAVSRSAVSRRFQRPPYLSTVA